MGSRTPLWMSPNGANSGAFLKSQYASNSTPNERQRPDLDKHAQLFNLFLMPGLGWACPELREKGEELPSSKVPGGQAFAVDMGNLPAVCVLFRFVCVLFVK